MKVFRREKGQAAVELAIFGTIILIAFSTLLMYGQRLEVQQQVKMDAFRKALYKAYDLNGSVTYTLKRDTRGVNLFGGFGQGQPLTASATANVMWQKGMSGDQGSKEQMSYSFYQINDDIVGDERTGLKHYPKKTYDYTGGEHTAMVPVTVWGEEQKRVEAYTSDDSKQESPSGIKNKAGSTLKDTVTTKLKTRVDTSVDEDLWDKESPLPVYYYDDAVEGPTTYTYEDKQYTVHPLVVAPQGAYYRQGTNSVEYSKDKAGTTIHREKAWQTSN